MPIKIGLMSEQFPKIIEIPKHSDIRGNLSVVDFKTCLPFDLKRVFYVYDIPSGTKRGGHAHHNLNQFIWTLSGVIEVATIDRKGFEKKWILQYPWEGLLIPPLTWAFERSLSAGCVYMVGASDYYDATDYIRDRNDFDAITIQST